MTFIKTYLLTSKVRTKLISQSNDSKLELRKLVLQSNMLDSLLDRLDSYKNEPATYIKPSNGKILMPSTRSIEINEEVFDSDSDSDSDDDFDLEEDMISTIDYKEEDEIESEEDFKPVIPDVPYEMTMAINSELDANSESSSIIQSTDTPKAIDDITFNSSSHISSNSIKTNSASLPVIPIPSINNNSAQCGNSLHLIKEVEENSDSIRGDEDDCVDSDDSLMEYDNDSDDSMDSDDSDDSVSLHSNAYSKSLHTTSSTPSTHIPSSPYSSSNSSFFSKSKLMLNLKSLKHKLKQRPHKNMKIALASEHNQYPNEMPVLSKSSSLADDEDDIHSTLTRTTTIQAGLESCTQIPIIS